MNLYIFNETSRAAVYGVGTYIRELTSSLKDSDINVCVVTLNSNKPQMRIEETDGIKYWYFPTPISELRITSDRKQRRLYYRNVGYLFQLHIKDKKELIFHLNFPQYGILAEELKKVFDCRIVSIVHFSDWGFFVFDNLQRLRNILNEEHPDDFGGILKKSVEEEKSYYSKADHCICLSNYMQEILCQDYDLDTEKISVIPNGLSDASETSSDPTLLRKKWHIQNGEKVILFAGRMDEIKGLSYLIKAFQEVLRTCPQSRLVIAGAGNFYRYTKESQEICTKITYTGLLDKAHLYEWYRLADVGVIPSLFEPFGFVAVEMMMHRLPMVVTATSGMNEVVDESCGLKIPLTILPDSVEIDASLLAQKIIYLLQNPTEAKRLKKNARKRYMEKYSSDVFSKNMIAFYKSLL
jgi:glycosyltransferase